jgi:DNA polymerase-3 subunit epsilon
MSALLHTSHLGVKLNNKGVEQEPIDWCTRFITLSDTAQDERLKTYYAAGVVAGNTPIDQVPLMALDIETTGLNPNVDGIVSVGMIPMTTKIIQASCSQHWVINPNVPLVDATVALHGITHSKVKNAPTFEAVLSDILQMMAGHVMVVHCRAIERSFINHALKRILNETIEIPMIDTMELEARLYRKPVSSSWLLNFFKNKNIKPVSIRLAQSRTRYGLPFYAPHHAVTDALATAELLQAQLAYRFLPETRLDEIWV